jgi:hypothetical protein
MRVTRVTHSFFRKERRLCMHISRANRAQNGKRASSVKGRRLELHEKFFWSRRRRLIFQYLECARISLQLAKLRWKRGKLFTEQTMRNATLKESRFHRTCLIASFGDLYSAHWRIVRFAYNGAHAVPYETVRRFHSCTGSVGFLRHKIRCLSISFSSIKMLHYT